MKKELLTLAFMLISLLFLISAVSAVEINLAKDSYQPMETLQTEITGNFIDNLILENVLIYKQGTPRSTPAISGLTKYGDIYYFYAILPNQEGNFSLKIENVRYTESGVQKTEPIEKKFTIKKGNQSAIQVNPGFVRTNEDFSIKVKSLTGNQGITVKIGGKSQNYSIIEDVEKTLQFSVSSLEVGKNDLKIIYSSETTKSFFSSMTNEKYYTIPVFITGKPIIINTSINQTNQTNQTIFNQTNQTINQTKVNVTNKTNNETKVLHCSDFGRECEDNEQCDEGTRSSLEGPCCPGTCVEQKQTSYTWIGVLLIIIVLFVVVYLYFKAKNKKPPTSEDILKRKSDKFNERMSGENKEVRGKLDSV